MKVRNLDPGEYPAVAALLREFHSLAHSEFDGTSYDLAGADIARVIADRIDPPPPTIGSRWRLTDDECGTVEAVSGQHVWFNGDQYGLTTYLLDALAEPIEEDPS